MGFLRTTKDVIGLLATDFLTKSLLGVGLFFDDIGRNYCLCHPSGFFQLSLCLELFWSDLF